MRGGAAAQSNRFRPTEVRSPRSREDRAWKCIEKIPIDESAFPAHVKPAAIIIGVKGSNHARMQDEAGCCVQLRGRGISSPGTPGADDPIHLWVKYDSPEQLQKVRDVLQEIIRSCEKGPPPELRKKALPTPMSVSMGGPMSMPAGIPGAPPNPLQPRGPRPGPFPTPLRTVLADLPDVLPPPPTRPPTSPLECFFTLHYVAHLRPDVTTTNLEGIYESVFSFPLEERLRSLGGSLVASLLMLPQIIKLEDVHTGSPPSQPPDPNAVFFIRPVLPVGLSWQLFSHHVNSMHATAQQPQPPPPPPPSSLPPTSHPVMMPGQTAIAPAMPPGVSPAAMPPSIVQGIGPNGTPAGVPPGMPPGALCTGLSYGVPAQPATASMEMNKSSYHGEAAAPPTVLPSPSNLAIQALHAILTDKALRQNDKVTSPPSLDDRYSSAASEIVRRWPGIPLAEIKNLFVQEVGFMLDAPSLGYADVATFLTQVASPQVLEVYWNPQYPPHGCHFVRIGQAGLHPDFQMLNAK